MLELLFKGLLQWLFDMVINITEYLANSLLTIFSMDLAYFEKAVPATGDIFNIITCLGWALMLGNLTFQSAKTMMTGLGFEGEAPQSLFARTFVMTFLMVFSRQVCDIGLGITKNVIELLEVPEIVQVPKLPESTFHVPGDASWLLAIIVGMILVVQIVKLFFEIGERYVVLAVLTVLSPLAFSMGGSKNTADIFKGWARMFGSMCLMTALGVVFLKFMLSTMSAVPSGVEVIPWTIFVVAIAKTGRKIDALIMRIGLNPAATGDPLGGISRMPGMLAYVVARNMVQNIGKSAAAGTSHNGQSGFRNSGSAGASPTPPVRPRPVSGGTAVRSSAEFAAGETAASPLQANAQTSGGGNAASHRQNTARPPIVGNGRGTGNNTPQNMGASAEHHSDASHTSAVDNRLNRNTVPAQPAAPDSGRNIVSTEARRASAPSAARPTAQTRMAQTAGVARGSGQNGVKSHNPAGGVPNPPSTGNAGISHAGRNAADNPPLRTNLADIKGGAPAPAGNVAQNTETTESSMHSENVSVRQSQASGRPPVQNGTPRPGSAGGGKQTRPPIHGSGALRHPSAPEGRQAQSRPDSQQHSGQYRETMQAERVLAQETAGTTQEMIHSQTHMRATAPPGGARPSAMPPDARPRGVVKTHGGMATPPGGNAREPMRDMTVHKAARNNAPENPMKPGNPDGSKPVPGKENTKIGHKQPPIPSPQDRDAGRRAAKPPHRTGDERK